MRDVELQLKPVYSLFFIKKKRKSTMQQALKDWILDTVCCIRFYSRIPVAKLSWETHPHGVPDFTTLPRALPVAAIIIALPVAIFIFMGSSLRIDATLIALLALGIHIMITGAFHEDGLADVADGFWGGATAERRLEIMKDSRVGTYGAVAVCLVLMLRAWGLMQLIEQASALHAGLIFILIAILSRVFALVPLTLLAPARTGGFSAVVGQPTPKTLLIAMGFATAICGIFALYLDISLIVWAIALLACGGITLWITRLSRLKVGGQTGDVAGATQQIMEIVLLIGLGHFAG
jgi:adenosylcobinamide-GDP ribazoletransferase